MKLHTFKKLLRFSINLLACQLYPRRKLTSWAQFPSDFKHSPLAKAAGLAKHAHSALQQRNANPFVGVPDLRDALPPYATLSYHLYSCLREPSHVQNSYSKQSLNPEMTQRSREKSTRALVCKKQQLRSPTWTTKQNKEKWKTVHLTAD